METSEIFSIFRLKIHIFRLQIRIFKLQIYIFRLKIENIPEVSNFSLGDNKLYCGLPDKRVGQKFVSLRATRKWNWRDG